jgi:hypothetical protein
MKTLFLLGLVTLALPIGLRGQTPLPIVTPVPGESSISSATAPAADDLQAALKLLNDLKAANAETLKTQEAQLATLDQLQEAADQIKIYTKRG